MVTLPEDEKKFEHTFSRFDTRHERDGQTDAASWHGPRYALRRSTKIQENNY